jgi:hypothetical protein
LAWIHLQRGGYVRVVLTVMDPTYDKQLIDANPVWELAFFLSEIQNDNAPIGWSKYIGAATCLLDNYEIKRKQREEEQRRLDMDKFHGVLKELPWGEDQMCIYTNGHVAPIGFLRAVKEFQASDISKDARNALVLDDVKHTRFTRMSPSECSCRGLDWGFWEQEHGRYKVTAVWL